MDPRCAFGRERSFVRRFLATWRSLIALLIVAGVVVTVPVEAQQDSGSTYGPVRPADTLWVLALRFRGDSDVTAQQAMIAILRANPEAFREGNINALRTGVTLRVPTVAEMAAITQGEAVAEFNRHEQAWRNRRRTGTAAPAPGPAAPARPAPAPSTPADTAEEEAGPEAELEAAREEVAELHKRLAERDEAIEDLLIQLAAVRRELRAARDGTTAPAVVDEEGAREDAASRATWLPVSPLVLGSSLIVLLVLIVVVTLIRQRGEREEPYSEGLDEDGDEDGEEEAYELEPDEEAEGALRDDRSEDASDGGERNEPSRVRAASASAAVAAGAFDAGPHDDDLPGDESTDLPIGMDLEGEEEEWGREDGKPSGAAAETEGTDAESELAPPIEVGDLDDLELDAGPSTGGFTVLDDDASPEPAEPGRPGGERRE